MAESLAGNISDMSLLEVLKLFNSGKMNGQLTVENNKEQGKIYVKDGQLIHCESGSKSGNDALIFLLDWDEGHFSFENNVETQEKSISTPTEQLLLDSARMINEWKDIKKVIPSMDIVFLLSKKSSVSAINLKPEEWKILAQINGNRSVKEIVAETGKDELEVAKVIFQLHSVGLLEKAEKADKSASVSVDESFFSEIEKELSKAIGPMASIIIDEAIEDIGQTRNAFPNDKIADLVERVSGEIENEDDKLKFTQIMIESLKKF
ncbi:DUF4388 domain-containing protein [candidate division KSB1 bacterium]|nr:DUF4388 domain-containing protein [candidate division KSB1 bacterium]MBL7092619.1 DUF4388 domain-containing protein [candidate division KSB1 bacterium]